jgi:hypothetical protein
MQLVRFRIRDRNDGSIRSQDERSPRSPHRKFGKETRQARPLDDDGKDPFPLLVDVNWTGERNRRMRSIRMDRNIEPAGSVGAEC